MSPLVFSIIVGVPMLVQLVVGVLGLAFSIKGRPSGVPALMVAGFVFMIVSMVLGIAWQFITLNRLDWTDWGYLGVDVPLGLIEMIAWLLVAIGVRKLIPRPQQPGYPGSAGYPMPGQPVPGQPMPGQPMPGQSAPVNPQPGYAPPGYAQPGYPQPGYTQPVNPQPGYSQPGYQQPNPGLPPQQPPGQTGW